MRLVAEASNKKQCKELTKNFAKHMISLHVGNAEMLYALATANRDRDDGDLDYDVYAFELYLEAAKLTIKMRSGMCARCYVVG